MTVSCRAPLPQHEVSRLPDFGQVVVEVRLVPAELQWTLPPADAIAAPRSAPRHVLPVDEHVTQDGDLVWLQTQPEYTPRATGNTIDWSGAGFTKPLRLTKAGLSDFLLTCLLHSEPIHLWSAIFCVVASVSTERRDVRWGPARTAASTKLTIHLQRRGGVREGVGRGGVRGTEGRDVRWGPARTAASTKPTIHLQRRGGVREGVGRGAGRGAGRGHGEAWRVVGASPHRRVHKTHDTPTAQRGGVREGVGRGAGREWGGGRGGGTEGRDVRWGPARTAASTKLTIHLQRRGGVREGVGRGAGRRHGEAWRVVGAGSHRRLHKTLDTPTVQRGDGGGGQGGGGEG